MYMYSWQHAVTNSLYVQVNQWRHCLCKVNLCYASHYVCNLLCKPINTQPSFLIHILHYIISICHDRSSHIVYDHSMQGHCSLAKAMKLDQRRCTCCYIYIYITHGASLHSWQMSNMVGWSTDNVYFPPNTHTHTHAVAYTPCMNHARLHAYTYTHTLTHSLPHAPHMHACTRTHTHTHAHTHTYTHTHTHTHTLPRHALQN